VRFALSQQDATRFKAELQEAGLAVAVPGGRNAAATTTQGTTSSMRLWQKTSM